MFCEPYFRFIITKGQKLLLALLIFRKTSWPSPLKILKPNLSLESRKKAIPMVSPFLPCLSFLPFAWSWFLLPQEMQCSSAGISDNRDPVLGLVLQNLPQPVFCKTEENQGKILENKLRRQFPKA